MWNCDNAKPHCIKYKRTGCSPKGKEILQQNKWSIKDIFMIIVWLRWHANNKNMIQGDIEVSETIQESETIRYFSKKNYNFWNKRNFNISCRPTGHDKGAYYWILYWTTHFSEQNTKCMETIYKSKL
jgi:hypothetical protein